MILSFALATLLIWVAHHRGTHLSVASEHTLQPAQYYPGVELPLALPDGTQASSLVFAYDAPLDQAWVYLECELLDKNGDTATTFFIELKHYSGVLDGDAWETGSQRGSQIRPISGDGPYRLTVKGMAGHGSDGMGSADDFADSPPVHLRILTGLPAVRQLTWAATLVSLLGIALLLRLLAPPRITPHLSPGPRKPRLVFLDGLRGVAVLSVLICHFFVPEISTIAAALSAALPASVPPLLLHGDLGVEIFFVLSGFVISYTVLDQRVSPGFTGRFVARRALRLDPPYYVALIIMLTVTAMNCQTGLTGAWHQSGGVGTALANMFYLHDLLHYPTPLDISWSLCLEIQFYLTFILISASAQRLARIRSPKNKDGITRRETVWFLTLMLPLMGFSLACWFPETNRFDFLGTWFRFALGVLTCWTFTRRISPRWFYLAMLCTGIPAILSNDVRGIAVVVTAGTIYYVAITRRLTTWLSGPAIQFLGKISYSLYLIHLAAGIFIVNLAWKYVPHTPTNALLLVPVGMASAIVGSMLIFTLFERPSVSVSQRMKKNPATRPAR